MELRHLRYFVAVAEARNITRASVRLRVAQPALSRQLADLEEELGLKLLERGRLGVSLTVAGREFHRRARALLVEASIEVGFVNVPGPLHGMDHCVVWRVPFRVVMPAKHRLARRKTLEFGDLTDEDFVFWTRESRPEFYDEFFRLCANAGFRPRVVHEVGGYPTTVLALVAQGVGLSVVPYFERVEGIRGLAWRTLARPQLWSDFALVWPRKAASPLAQAFAALARERLGVEPAAGGVVGGF